MYAGIRFLYRHTRQGVVLEVYRICGLWVAAAGCVSGALALGDWDEEVRSWACVLYAAVHSVESVVKLQPDEEGGRPTKLALLLPNGHLALALLVAAVV